MRQLELGLRSLDEIGEFSVSAIGAYIDDNILPTSLLITCQNKYKYTPIKNNILFGDYFIIYYPLESILCPFLLRPYRVYDSSFPWLCFGEFFVGHGGLLDGRCSRFYWWKKLVPMKIRHCKVVIVTAMWVIWSTRNIELFNRNTFRRKCFLFV